FEPRLLRVRPGQAIRFDNSDDVLHSLLLVGRESVIGGEFVDPGQSYTVRIPLDMPPGTYELACTVHVDMRGQIVVGGGQVKGEGVRTAGAAALWVSAHEQGAMTTEFVLRDRWLRERFERQTRPLLAALHRAARRLSAQPADAEDLVHDTYVKA